MANAVSIRLPLDRGAGGHSDPTDTLRKTETALNNHEVALYNLQPQVRVITADSLWQSTDRTILIDTTAQAVNLTIPTPSDMLNAGFIRLVINWISGGNNATINTADGSTINGAVGYLFVNILHGIELYPVVTPGYWGYIGTLGGF